MNDLGTTVLVRATSILLDRINTLTLIKDYYFLFVYRSASVSVACKVYYI
jgi:hypothetical protein